MGGKRSDKWPDERLEQVKAFMLEGLSMAEIGRRLDPVETRMAVLGVIHRNPEVFAKVPRLKAAKPQAAIEFAKGKPRGTKMPRTVAGSTYDPEYPSALDGFTKIEGRPDEIREPWKAIQKGDKLFVYYGMALNPTFIFTRPYAGANWRGHGIHADTKGRIFAWCNIQKANHRRP